MLGSECDLKTHVRYVGYHLPSKSGVQKTTFFDFTLTATLTAYIFGTKHIDNRASALTLEGVAYIV